ncbi:NAD(P)-dependent oxidoreductase [Desulforamulus ferrireducens]|uniref:Pyridine nucleotide-disulfide oxidoreductase n=1 Tax=Desulforamulus ferrireducens TaxID=1833852 RepID=A0A1S6ITZ0_9FIRM|nr:NAD(P)-dependent oxidoreductase [Desulforamulus ferrireducens]AQS58246.1 pyridine nucleotide-disulfide oxidoreductase [Desulforamulus ferrireducens]
MIIDKSSNFNEKELNFDEIDQGFTTKEAIAEARRCLNCSKPQCRTGCPIDNNIPAFIQALSKGNIGEAREIIAERSNLPAVCGRVCPHEKQCEGHCILNKKQQGIKIGKLERFIADFDAEMDLSKEKMPAKTKGKVAVIGSGPAGLTVAGDLAKEGFNVVVYEAESEPGGVLLYGIPEYRLPKEVVRQETERIASLGVTFITNCLVGESITLDQMFAQGFDAVFIGTGTALAKDLTLPGRELHGIVQATYFLRTVTLYNQGNLDRKEVPVNEGDKVLLIGAGNVAMDAARTALRLGASEVTVVYRRQESEIPALRAEYEGAVAEGVKFSWQTSPLAFVGEGGVLTGLEVASPAGKTVLKADKILLAIGSRPAARIVSTTTGIEVNPAGYVITKERPYGMTTRKGVFAGGDVVHQPATVVLAMKEAKLVAKGIAAYVEAKKLLEEC